MSVDGSASAGLYALLETRHSVRLFSTEPVPIETVNRVLTAATTAPSAHGGRPWRFEVVERGERRANLVAAFGVRFRQDLEADGTAPEEVERLIRRSDHILLGAPIVVVVGLDARSLRAYPDGRRRRLEYVMAVQSVAMAGGFLLLAAHAEGLGACWMSAPLFAPEAALESLALPASYEPQGLVVAGWPFTGSRPRR